MPCHAHTPRRAPALLLTAGLLAGCAAAPRGPEATAEAYARALEEGRLEEAWALTRGSPQAEAAFRAAYAQHEARRARADAVRAALGGLTAHAPGLTLVREAQGWRVVERPPDEAPRAALSRFLDALEAGDWASAWALLAPGLRARYTPERLREDHRREPLAAERLRRARLALAGPLVHEGRDALFPLGEGRAVRLVPEGEHWRVAALE